MIDKFMEEIFESSVRTAGDLAGIFEFDGDSSYFYLIRTSNPEGQKIIGAIRICPGIPDFKKNDIFIKWDQTENNVGLMIRGKLWAAFGNNGSKFGGDYKVGGIAKIPSHIIHYFEHL